MRIINMLFINEGIIIEDWDSVQFNTTVNNCI